MTKQEIISQVTDVLRQQFKTMSDAAKDAHAASTGADAKAEGKYDTRGLEASYLADAQAEQTHKLAQSLRIFESLSFDDFPPGSPVEPGSLVETEHEGQINYYLLTPCAGGVTIAYEGEELTTLSPESLLYQQLLGSKPGDLLDEPDIMILEVR